MADATSPRRIFETRLAELVEKFERHRGTYVRADYPESQARLERSPAAAEPATVEVGSRRLDSGRVLLWVEDEGDGIAAPDLPHVFEPYFTTKRTGTGLGLAITRKTIEALGGTLRLESRQGSGTRVEIELPSRPPSVPATENR